MAILTVTEQHWYRDDYLGSAHWRNTRSSALLLAHYRCQDCGSTERLDVHHLHYRTLGEENVGRDLRVLCRSCHEATHALIDERQSQERERYAAQKEDAGDRFRALALRLLDDLQPNVRYEAWRDAAMQEARAFIAARSEYVWHPGEQYLQHLIRDGYATKRVHSIKGKRIAFYYVSDIGRALLGSRAA